MANLVTTPTIVACVDYENGFRTNKSSKTGKIISIDSEDFKSGQDLLTNDEYTGRYTRGAKIVGNDKWPPAKLPHKCSWATLPWFLRAASGSLSSGTNAGSGCVIGAATLTNGKVTSVAITNGGTLYAIPPKIVLTGGTGSGAVVHATVAGGIVTVIVVDNGGNYSVAPTGGTVTNNVTHTIDIDGELPSFIFERKVPFGTAEYYWYNGCVVASMSLKIGPTGFFNPEFSVKPALITIGTSAYDGAATDMRSTATVTGRKVHHAMLGTGSVLIDGATSTSLKLLDLTLNLTNELVEDEYVITGGGTLDMIARIQAKVTATATLSVRDQAIVDLLRDKLDHSLGFTWKDLDQAFQANLNLPALQFDVTEPSGATRGAFRLNATAEAHEDGSAKVMTWAVSNDQATGVYA